MTLVQVNRAKIALDILNKANPESEEFCQALADIHVCATVLTPYSEGLLEAINQYTEDNPN